MLLQWIVSALVLTLASALPLRHHTVHTWETFTNTTTANTTATNTTTNDTVPVSLAAATTTSDWWFPNIDLSNPDYGNSAPNLGDDNSYPVYVAVESGDANGLVNAIISNGPNNGQRYNGYLAAQPRVIYLAPGTYELNSTLFLYTDTVIIGDASSPPTISASSDFNGTELICGGQDDSEAVGGELKFSTMVKNVILDTRANSGASNFTALSWRVAQNSALVNVEINLPQSVHTGISLGQGSTVQVGDTTIRFGNIGLAYTGMQQATLKNMTFEDCTIAIDISGGFTVNIFAATFNTVGSPIILEQQAGPWISVIDATSINSGTFFTSNNPYPNFMLENIVTDNAQSDVAVVSGVTKVSGQTHTGTYVFGNVYGADPIYQTNGAPSTISRPAQLAPGGSYPVASANQYPDATVSDVINLKDTTQNGGFALKGDGVTDDGAALQNALDNAASQNKIAFLPFGVYRTEVTITIPAGTELVGNGWSTISGYGSNFADSSNPTPVVEVGAPGETGTAHIQDIRFTVGEELPGAIVLRVNMAGTNPGDVSIHNSLITIGGTPDSTIDCTDPATCQSTYLGLHLAATSSAYIDNVWVWVADHYTDGSTRQTDSSAKGGVLVEATQGTWLAGLAAEHFWLYNVAYNNAANVFMSLLQTETNYFQGTNAQVITPSPWTPTASDPDFSWCDSSDADCPKTVAQYYNGGSGLRTYASASWNFDSYGGGQTYMNVMSDEPADSLIYGLCAHDTTYAMLLPNGTAFGSADDGFSGSWGNLVAELDTT
ncbi:hypothetical protein LTR85_011286 [Meristemomyces frigidus]|nr:hypothetical protein LTR85_011286 [Meristemomyces frigidus]